MDCPSCQTPPGVTDVFCAECGAALRGETDPARLAVGVLTGTGPGGASLWRPVSEEESRSWAVAAHLSALAGGAIGGVPAFLGPLVVWLVRKEIDPYAAAHGRAAFNFSLSVVIYGAVLVALTMLTVGLGALLTVPAGVVLALAWVAFTLAGARRAAADRLYRYPLAIPFLR